MGTPWRNHRLLDHAAAHREDGNPLGCDLEPQWCELEGADADDVPAGGRAGFTGVGYINNQTNGLFNYNHPLRAGAEILYKF